jgi:hypothetical protein
MHFANFSPESSPACGAGELLRVPPALATSSPDPEEPQAARTAMSSGAITIIVNVRMAVTVHDTG